MSMNEVERITVIEQVAGKRLKQREAMKLLGLSKRQIIRLVKCYRREGATGLTSKHRGRASNRQYSAAHREQIKSLVHQHYADFGPTFAAEKLRERHDLRVNKETLRQWMIEWALWNPTRQKKATLHQSRERRACFGELIQLDGSHHDWFEGRAAKCCLLVLIDDATSQLVGLRFENHETTAGYFRVVRDYIGCCGRPLAFYSDRDSVFRINRPDRTVDAQTQFERAMEELAIEVICANSPQAKGRVERANGTLQDRLVKELRLCGINTQEAANAFLPAFMGDYNKRFAVAARSTMNAHRQELPMPSAMNLIFSMQQTRTLSKNLELSYKNSIFQVKVDGIGYGLRHAKVTVCEDMSGKVSLLYKGRELPYAQHARQKRVSAILGSKQLSARLDNVVHETKKNIPARDHPWRRYVVNPAKPASENSRPRNNG